MTTVQKDSIIVVDTKSTIIQISFSNTVKANHHHLSKSESRCSELIVVINKQYITSFLTSQFDSFCDDKTFKLQIPNRLHLNRRGLAA